MHSTKKVSLKPLGFEAFEVQENPSTSKTEDASTPRISSSRHPKQRGSTTVSPAIIASRTA